MDELDRMLNAPVEPDLGGLNMDFIHQIESSGGTDKRVLKPNSAGALGEYQLTPVAYKELQDNYPDIYGKAKFEDVALDPSRARWAAWDFSRVNEKYLKHYGVPVTDENLAAAYRMGGPGVGVAKGDFNKFTPGAQDYIKKYRKLKQQKEQGKKKGMDLSALNPFAVTEAQAAEPDLDSMLNSENLDSMLSAPVATEDNLDTMLQGNMPIEEASPVSSPVVPDEPKTKNIRDAFGGISEEDGKTLLKEVGKAAKGALQSTAQGLKEAVSSFEAGKNKLNDAVAKQVAKIPGVVSTPEQLKKAEEAKQKFIAERMKRVEGPAEFKQEMARQFEHEWNLSRNKVGAMVDTAMQVGMAAFPEYMVGKSILGAGANLTKELGKAAARKVIGNVVRPVAMYTALDQIYDLKKMLPENTKPWISDMATLADFASKGAVIGAVEKMPDVYRSVQGKYYAKLTPILEKEVAGAFPDLSAQQVKDVVAQQMWKNIVNAPFSRKTPFAINKTIKVLQDNPGKFGEALRAEVELRKPPPPTPEAPGNLLPEPNPTGIEGVVPADMPQNTKPTPIGTSEGLKGPIAVSKGEELAGAGIVQAEALETQKKAIPGEPEKALSKEELKASTEVPSTVAEVESLDSLPAEVVNALPVNSYYGTTNQDVIFGKSVPQEATIDTDISVLHAGSEKGATKAVSRYMSPEDYKRIYGKEKGIGITKPNAVLPVVMTNVGKVLQVKDILGNHDNKEAVFEMLKAANGLTPRQISYLEEAIKVLDDHDWLAKARKALVDNGYTHLFNPDTAEGGHEWMPLKDDGFKIVKEHAVAKEEAPAKVEIKRAPPQAPAGTISYNDLLKTGQITEAQVLGYLDEAVKMNWKKTKGIGVQEGVRDFEEIKTLILDQVFSEGPRRLRNRNWNPKTQNLNKWLKSACDTVVKEAIQELSTTTGKAQDRVDIAMMAKYIVRVEKWTGRALTEAEARKGFMWRTLGEERAAKAWSALRDKKVSRDAMLESGDESAITQEDDILAQNGIEPESTDTGITEMHAGPSFKVQLPSIKEVVDNVKENLEFTKEQWNAILNPLKFWPELNNHPIFKNAIRKDLIGLPHTQKNWIYERLYPAIWGNLNQAQQANGFEILKLKTMLERVQKGRISPLTEPELQKLLKDELAKADPDTLKATEKWKRLEQAMKKELVTLGMMDKDDGFEDHVMLMVKDKYQHWQLWSSYPKQVKRPYQGYLKKATGTKKEYLVNLDTLLGSMYRIQLDLGFIKFSLKWLEHFDIQNKMSEADRMALFGKRMAFGKYPYAASPVPGKEYEINGKKYTGYQYEHNKRMVFKNVDEQLVLGAWNKVYLIPSDLVPVFKALRPTYSPFVDAVMYPVNKYTAWFKRMAIASSWIGFNINNMFGDGYILYLQSPKAFAKVPSAIQFLIKNPKNYTPYEKKLADFILQEQTLANFAEAETQYDKTSKNPLHLAVSASAFRENILRTALSMHLFDNLERGNNLAPKFDWIDTKGLSPREANGKVAREAMIDYEATSYAYNKYVRGAFAPFATWYVKWFNLAMNMIKKHPFKALSAMLAPMVVLNMANNRDKETREIEKHLPDYIKTRGHLILGKSKRPGHVMVHALQWPTDAIPVFPMVNIGTKNAFRLKNGEISLKEAVADTLLATGKASWKQINYLATPFKRFFEGVVSNRDPVSKKEIIPFDGKVNLPMKAKYLSAFFFNTLTPPVSLAMRSQNQLDFSPDDSFMNSAGRLVKGWWNIYGNLGFKEVKLGNDLDEITQAADKARVMLNTYTQRYIEDFTANKQQPVQVYIDQAMKDGLATTREEAARVLGATIKSVENNPVYLKANLEEQLRHTEDPERRMRLQSAIQTVEMYRQGKSIKSTPKAARGMTLRELYGE